MNNFLYVFPGKAFGLKLVSTIIHHDLDPGRLNVLLKGMQLVNDIIVIGNLKLILSLLFRS